MSLWQLQKGFGGSTGIFDFNSVATLIKCFFLMKSDAEIPQVIIRNEILKLGSRQESILVSYQLQTLREA